MGVFFVAILCFVNILIIMTNKEGNFETLDIDLFIAVDAFWCLWGAVRYKKS